MVNKNNFKENLAKHNIILTSEMEEQFDLYFKLLDKYNKVMDLTNVINEDDVYERHFYNSISIAFDDNFNGLSFCDVGAGAGFPSIPLKIVFPDMKLTILDPLTKRMNFINIVVDKLNLKDVSIIKVRAEDALNLKESFDIVSARAVAPLNILCELVCHLPKVGGRFIAMKGIKGNEELENANHALKETNFRLVKTDNIEPSINFTFIKDKPNDKYPRSYSKIKQKPL